MSAITGWELQVAVARYETIWQIQIRNPSGQFNFTEQISAWSLVLIYSPQRNSPRG